MAASQEIHLRNFYDGHLNKHFLEYNLLQVLGDITGKSVLEVGCEGGYYCRLIKERGASLVVGIDMSVQEAKDHEQHSPLGIDYISYEEVDKHRYPSFDVVVMMMYLNTAPSHLDVHNLCQSAYRCLTPGGRLVTILSHCQPSPVFFDFRNLGLTISCSEVSNGISQAVTRPFFLVPGEDRVGVMHLYDKTYFEQCLQQLGFCLLEWRPCLASPHSNLSDEYWNDIVESQFFKSLVCVKSNQ